MLLPFLLLQSAITAEILLLFLLFGGIFGVVCLRKRRRAIQGVTPDIDASLMVMGDEIANRNSFLKTLTFALGGNRTAALAKSPGYMASAMTTTPKGHRHK